MGHAWWSAMAFAVSTGLRDAGFHALTENLALELRKDGP
jgi:hypothetical protein